MNMSKGSEQVREKEGKKRERTNVDEKKKERDRIKKLRRTQDLLIGSSGVLKSELM